MVQHINLLTRRQAPQRFFLLALTALGVLTLVLAALAGRAEWQLQQQSHLEEKTLQSLNEFKAALERKRQTLGLTESETLGRQIALLRSQVEARREWVDLQQKGELGSAMGYSQWLETLAGVHVDGVWLQGLDIGKGGQSVSVQGKALSADAVMHYIVQINDAFKPMGVRFTSMEITQDAGTEQGVGRVTPTLSFKIH